MESYNPENRIIQAKSFFIRSFQELTKDFNLSNSVKIRFSEKNSNILELFFSCESDNSNFQTYLRTAILNSQAYKNFVSISLEEIHFIDEKRKEYQVMSLDELRETVNRIESKM